MLRLKGIKKVSGETKELKGYYSPEYLQLNVNKVTGEVWTNYHYNLGQNSWTQYEDDNILNCGNICNPMTMSEIKEMVMEAIERRS